VGGTDRIQAPDLPELELQDIADGDVDLSGALVKPGAVRVQRVRIRESELRGVTVEAPGATGLTVVDAILRDCSLSNLDGRDGMLWRVTADHCRLIGLNLGAGEIGDLRVTDSSLELASFAGAELRDVSFERVVLTEASFLEARLDHVQFIDCELAGADFRGARCTDCVIRGASLDGVVGVEALRGVEMPWSDVIASAGALAGALGIIIADG
jgi:uncharacterized protein YjbI with pentapeptide repeats